MKDPEKKSSLISFMAFVALIVFAVIELFNVLSPVISLGEVLAKILNTIKNVCIIIVIGVTSYSFVKEKGKGVKITYLIAVLFFAVETILTWVIKSK
ncbi:MAG: hypothetical protein MJ066_02670 [Clostridia bacterium]|nr:hypothetical protein [Clostridia bacterium]